MICQSNAPAPPALSISAASTSPLRCMTEPSVSGTTTIEPPGVRSSSAPRPGIIFGTVPSHRDEDNPSPRGRFPPRQAGRHRGGEPTRGLEPLTARLQVGCATSCATPAGHGNKSRDKHRDNAGDNSAASTADLCDRQHPPAGPILPGSYPPGVTDHQRGETNRT